MLKYLSHVVIRFPRTILVMLALVTAFFGYHIRSLRVDFSIEQLFPQNDPDRDVYFDFRQDFALDDDLFLMVYETDSLFSPGNLELLRQLTWELEDMDGIEEVFSLTNVERLSLDDDLLTMDYYFPDDLPLDQAGGRRDELLQHPLYKNVVLSGDGSLGGILVNVDDDYNTHAAREELLAGIDSLRITIPWEWHDAGLPIVRTRYVQLMNRERAIFLPLAVLMSLIMLYLLFRQWRAVLAPLTAILTTLTWMAGLMSLAGITINIVSFITFNLLLIVGVSNGIHLMTKYYEVLNQGFDHNAAVQEIILRIGAALFLTSFTTATGFFSLIATNIRIVQEFGVVLAMGAMLMFLLTIIIIPALLVQLSKPGEEEIRRHAEGTRLKAARTLGRWNEEHPRVIVGGALLLLMMAAWGISRVDTNAPVLQDLRSGDKLSADLQFIERHMGNILPLEIVYHTNATDGILEPENLQRLHALQTYVESFDEVGSATSISDHLMLLNQLLGTGDRAIPESREQVNDFLALYDEATVEGLVDFNYSKGRISARIRNIRSDQANRIKGAVMDWAGTYLPDGQSIQLTGATLLALKTNDHLVKNLTYSFLFAFLIIFISMMFLFKSVRLAGLSIFPNILPLLAAGGFMGFAGIELRPTTAMTFAIAFGIAVDNTIHFLARFRQEFERNEGHYRPAIRQTLVTTGKAIISTTAVLLLGFSVLLLSRFVPQFEFSLIAGLILTVALLASITLLPVLVTLARPRLRK
ncbi:MAG: MMPL family transporter [Candidatus Marinimicrobia bacterium]|nr:MMPL family transporter [Candidatus Neomarinimicrobiota bacterium]